MNNLIKDLDLFILSLDNDENIINLKKSYDEIKKDSELSNLLNEYFETNDDKIRESLINNPKVRNSKHYESIINYIILEINKELKTISKGNKDI